MTPAEFGMELDRLAVVCGKCWTDRDSAIRAQWVVEIRRMFETLDYTIFHQAVSLVIETHTDARQLPTPHRLRECYEQKRPRHTSGDRCLCCGRAPCHWTTRAGHHEWMVTEAASMTPAQAKRTLEAASSKVALDAEVLSILREVAASDAPAREPEPCISGPKCLAGNKCVERATGS